MTHSLTTPDRDGSRSRDFSSFWFDNLSPISIVTDCHNLVSKKSKRNSLFLNHLRIVGNLTGNELTKRDQIVVNQSIDIVFPIKRIQSNRSDSSFLG